MVFRGFPIVVLGVPYFVGFHDGFPLLPSMDPWTGIECHPRDFGEVPTPGVSSRCWRPNWWPQAPGGLAMAAKKP